MKAHFSTLSEGTNELTSTAGKSGRPPELAGRMTQVFAGHREARREPHVLIVSSDEALADSLISALDEWGLAVERAANMRGACVLAESGHFYVVLTEPTLTDGSWRRLANRAKCNRSQFVVVLLARGRDLRQRVYAKNEEVFDVLDVSNELSRAGEVVMRALWLEYLNGVGPVPDLLCLRGKEGGTH